MGKNNRGIQKNYFVIFLKDLNICQLTIEIVINKIIKVNGLSHKKLNEPSLINSDLLKFSSINFPKTNAKINGGIGKSYKRKKVATTAIPIIR